MLGWAVGTQTSLTCSQVLVNDYFQLTILFWFIDYSGLGLELNGRYLLAFDVSLLLLQVVSCVQYNV